MAYYYRPGLGAIGTAMAIGMVYGGWENLADRQRDPNTAAENILGYFEALPAELVVGIGNVFHVSPRNGVVRVGAEIASAVGYFFGVFAGGGAWAIETGFDRVEEAMSGNRPILQNSRLVPPMNIGNQTPVRADFLTYAKPLPGLAL